MPCGGKMRKKLTLFINRPSNSLRMQKTCSNAWKKPMLDLDKKYLKEVKRIQKGD